MGITDLAGINGFHGWKYKAQILTQIMRISQMEAQAPLVVADLNRVFHSFRSKLTSIRAIPQPVLNP
jgi:hypothetical protein